MQFDTVIVGGGLCGLVLADALRQNGQTFALFEARERLGGRILSEKDNVSGMMVDLGPCWFWPEVQPRLLKLVNALGLVHFPQHDNGAILSLTDPNQPPEQLTVESVHGGAHRVAGGMGAMVTALAQHLAAEAIHLQHELVALEDKGDHVELHFRHNDTEVIIYAKQVVLTLPPRLLAEHVRFTPVLDASLLQAMRTTHTWMADQAKMVMGYHTAFWREAGYSGNAFVNHAQVVLAEIYDACDADAEHAALGGFVAMTPEARAPYAVSMPMLLESQLGQVFGMNAINGELHYQDWANEKFSCATLDRVPLQAHPVYANHKLREQHWGGKLLLGGSETASQAGGYLEGALDAGARLALILSTHQSPLPADAKHANELGNFSRWVAAQRSQAQEHYHSHLNRALAAQQKQQLTQQALLDTVEQIYSDALQRLGTLPLDTHNVTVEQGRSALTPVVLTPFNGFIRELVDTALEFNRNSCAISNFPQEAAPDAPYLDAIRRDMSAAWREFALSVNDALLEKSA
ncbi:MAG: NAD(P)-binding protein [Methylophilaceae bacterium]|nr:NAD(P)-binding protein [Methylophilaceae bacterium]